MGETGLGTFLLFALATIPGSLLYLKLIPSDRSPLLTPFCEIPIKHYPFDYPGLLSQLIQSIFQNKTPDLPVFTLSLDSSEVLFSKTSTLEEFSSEDLVNWQLIQSGDESFQKSFRTLSYPLSSDENVLMNIHISEKKLNSIDHTMKNFRGEMRSVCVGIFSAEMGARSWMKAGENESYIIWRMGKYNSDQILIIKNDELHAYCFSKRNSNNIKKLTMIGNEDMVDLFFEDLNSFHSGSTDQFRSAQKIFVYQGEGRSSELKKVCESGVENISLLNPLSVLNCEDISPGNLYLNSQLAETGVSFRGIYV